MRVKAIIRRCNRGNKEKGQKGDRAASVGCTVVGVEPRGQGGAQSVISQAKVLMVKRWIPDSGHFDWNKWNKEVRSDSVCLARHSGENQKPRDQQGFLTCRPSRVLPFHTDPDYPFPHLFVSLYFLMELFNCKIFLI